MKYRIHFFIAMVALTSAMVLSAFTYKGQTLAVDNSFVRSQSGSTNKNDITEVSGIACSVLTPGYLWAQKDEGTSSILALNASTGAKMMTLNLKGTGSRDDWEDLCIGSVNGISMIFLGAFGDNDLVFANNYQIHCFAEPTISSGSKSVSVRTITFGFPDGNAHNVETLMFDNVEQRFYIVDKVKDGVCTLYYLPYTNATTLQTLTQVCALGNSGEKFDFVTGGDISPDGHWVLIKNKKYVLLWERQGTESLSVTLQRQPVFVNAYQEEEQGEAIAWLDNSTFFTTSDSKKNTPIYKYERPLPTPTDIPEVSEMSVLDVSAPADVYDMQGRLLYRGILQDFPISTSLVIVRQQGKSVVLPSARLRK